MKKTLTFCILLFAFCMFCAFGAVSAGAAAAHTHDMSVTCQGSGVTFTEWIGSDMNTERPGIQITGGSYYLTGDVNITEDNKINIPSGSTVNLCLNGHSFTMSGTTEKIGAFMVSGTFNICDCGGGGSISYDACSGVYISNDGTVNIYGGTFSDKYGIYNYAGTLYAYDGIFDGRVVDIYNRNTGCGIYLTGSPTLDSIYVDGHYSPDIYASVGGVPYAGGPITIEYSELDEDYCIGMTAVQEVTDANKDKFAIKNDGWSLSHEDSRLKLDIIHAIHSWNYTAEDKDNDGYEETINAYCVATGSCNSTANKTITILPPAMKVSDDGNSASVTIADGKTSIGGRTKEDLPSFHYYLKDGNTWELYGYTAPTAHGTYKATLTLYPAVAEVVYTIAAPAHTHSWKYTANGDTITATCQTANCPVTGTKTIVISAVSKTYNGTAVTATVTNHIDNTDYNASIVYEAKTGTLTDGKAVNVGTYSAKITVGGVTASVDFEITPVIYDVTVTDDGNGTSSASPSYGAQGTKITLTATPNKGYRFKEWKVENNTVTVENNSFTMPASDVTLKAIFTACSHTDGSATYTSADSSTQHTKTYSCCGAEVLEDHFTQKSENKASCKEAAACDRCGESYGEVDKANHDETVAYENGFCPHCDAYEAATLHNNGTENDTTDDYYEIGNAGQLYWFAAQVDSGSNKINVILTANIVVNNNVLVDGELNPDANAVSSFRQWTAIGTYSWSPSSSIDYRYQGTFDGKGHAVSGLYYNVVPARTTVGFFSYLAEGGTVQNVGIIDSYFYGGTGIAGIVARNMGGTVKNCYNEGRINGGTNDWVGGIVGCNETGTVINCYNVGKVSGDSGVGGVIGSLSSGTVLNCYYLASAETDSIDGTTFKTSAQFASGEVAYLLGEGWGQTIGTDSYPTPGGDKVYYGYTTCDAAETTPVYSNVSTAAEKPAHQMAAATCTAPNSCTICGHAEGEALGHSYDNACDAACNTCGTERTVGEHADADENELCDHCNAELPKNRLPVGAIVGIVLGAAVLLGGGGFALYWFVIKKKKWSDLVSIFKKK